MIQLEIDPTQSTHLTEAINKRLIKAAEAAINHLQDAEKLELTLALSSNERVQEMNLAYLGVDSPTDVLSFPAGDTNPESGNTYLGDVIIAVPQAITQATAAGHPLEDELALLTVHAVLHLLGFDHADEAEKTRMWAAQHHILSTLGIPAPPV